MRQSLGRTCHDAAPSEQQDIVVQSKKFLPWGWDTEKVSEIHGHSFRTDHVRSKPEAKTSGLEHGSCQARQTTGDIWIMYCRGLILGMSGRGPGGGGLRCYDDPRNLRTYGRPKGPLSGSSASATSLAQIRWNTARSIPLPVKSWVDYMGKAGTKRAEGRQNILHIEPHEAIMLPMTYKIKTPVRCRDDRLRLPQNQVLQLPFCDSSKKTKTDSARRNPQVAQEATSKSQRRCRNPV